MNLCRWCKCEVKPNVDMCNACKKIKDMEDEMSTDYSNGSYMFSGGSTVTAISSRKGDKGRWLAVCYSKNYGISEMWGETEIDSLERLKILMDGRGEVWPKVEQEV